MIFRLLWGKKKRIGSGVFDEGAPQILQMLIVQKVNGNDYIIMMCILFVNMICLKVLHFVQPTQQDIQQFDVCWEQTWTSAVLAADSLNYTRAIYSNSLSVAQNSPQPV